MKAPSPSKGGLPIAHSDAAEDTFILGGQPYVYTEQEWSCFPEVARQAYRETLGAAYVYWLGMHTGQLVENGVALTIPEMKARLLELVAGLYRLAPYAQDLSRAIRRTVNGCALLVSGSIILPDHD